MFAQGQASRAAAGERHVLKFEKRNDVLVEGAVVLELVGQVKDEIGLKRPHFLPDEAGVIKDRQVFGGATERLQRFEHVGFGLPVFGLEFFAQILVERRGTDGVEQGKDVEFLFHAVRSLPGSF